MLSLSRKVGEKIVIGIGDGITLEIIEIRPNRVHIGVTAPADVSVHRAEVHERIKKEGDRRAEDR